MMVVEAVTSLESENKLDAVKKEVKKYVPFNTDDFQKKQDEKEVSEDGFEDMKIKVNTLITFFTEEKDVVGEYIKKTDDSIHQNAWKELEKDIGDILIELEEMLKTIGELEKRLIAINEDIKVAAEKAEKKGKPKDIAEYDAENNRMKDRDAVYDELNLLNTRLHAIWDEEMLKIITRHNELT